MRTAFVTILLAASAMSQTPRRLVTSAVDETKLARIAHNLHPEATKAANDKGKVADSFGSSGNSACNSSLGSSISSSCVFYDITIGDTTVSCGDSGTGYFNCYNNGGNFGALSLGPGSSDTTSTTSFSAAYPATSGWDFATGLGSVNVYNLVNAWANLPNPNKVLGGSAKFGGSGVE
jgi:hypothetical protein